MTEHDSYIMELVGSHAWRALRQEADVFLKYHHNIIYEQATDEFDFIKKEVSTGVVRELRRFFAGIEQKAEEIATRDDEFA